MWCPSSAHRCAGSPSRRREGGGREGGEGQCRFALPNGTSRVDLVGGRTGPGYSYVGSCNLHPMIYVRTWQCLQEVDNPGYIRVAQLEGTMAAGGWVVIPWQCVIISSRRASSADA